MVDVLTSISGERRDLLEGMCCSHFKRDHACVKVIITVMSTRDAEFPTTFACRKRCGATRVVCNHLHTRQLE